jgi:hypothetical protein
MIHLPFLASASYSGTSSYVFAFRLLPVHPTKRPLSVQQKAPLGPLLLGMYWIFYILIFPYFFAAMLFVISLEGYF